MTPFPLRVKMFIFDFRISVLISLEQPGTTLTRAGNSIRRMEERTESCKRSREGNYKCVVSCCKMINHQPSVQWSDHLNKYPVPSLTRGKYVLEYR